MHATFFLEEMSVRLIFSWIFLVCWQKFWTFEKLGEKYEKWSSELCWWYSWWWRLYLHDFCFGRNYSDDKHIWKVFWAQHCPWPPNKCSLKSKAQYPLTFIGLPTRCQAPNDAIFINVCTSTNWYYTSTLTGLLPSSNKPICSST